MGIVYIHKWFHVHAWRLLKLDTVVPNSLHSRCFLDSTFLSKERSTCDNINHAPSFLNQLLQVLCVLLMI
jgi:hypothetical protein